MAYSVNFNKQSLKQLAKINEPYYSNIKAAIYGLADNPRPHGSKRLTDRTGYRIRVGNYRIIYDIFDKQLIVEIIAVGDRKDIYQ
jgi:mRNA interferase RelE/StbE